MSQTIDPYHRFLGIPPHLQPPNHYRLLGLELFEGNLDVISDAADRQMAHVRRYEGSPYADDAQKLLSELAAARVCLLLPERKSVYDDALRKQLASAAAQAPSHPQRTGNSLPKTGTEEESISMPDPKPRASPSTHAPPKSGSGVALRRASPSASGIHKSAPPSAAPRSIATPPAAKFPPAAKSPPSRDPATYEPPYMGEYRRRFFESLLKFAIFIFILIVALLLLNAFALPWLKDEQSSPAPSYEKETAISSTAENLSLPPSSVQDSPKEDAAEESEPSSALEIPVENTRETEPEPTRESIFKTIQKAIRNDEIRRTNCIGGDSGEAFEAKNSEGGLLIALKLTWKKFGKNNEYRAVSSVQPEFLTSLGYVKGSIYGSPQKNGLRFLAKHGYAIGALKINYAPGNRNMNGEIAGLRIVFMRIERGRLNPEDSYSSSPFPLDFSVPRNAPQIGGNGDLAVGICGTSTAEDLRSLGLLLLKQKPPPQPIAGTKQSPPPNERQSTADSIILQEGEDNFIGIWNIYEDGRFTSSVTLFANHQARDSRYHERGGKWEYRKDQARIFWKDGWKDILLHGGDAVRKYSFAPGDPEENSPVNEGTALKCQKAAGE